MIGIQPIFFQKNFTNYLEKENLFCIFVVKLPFHYNKFESNLAKGKRSFAFRQMIKCL